jgi:hypothetical protein
MNARYKAHSLMRKAIALSTLGILGIAAGCGTLNRDQIQIRRASNQTTAAPHSSDRGAVRLVLSEIAAKHRFERRPTSMPLIASYRQPMSEDPIIFGASDFGDTIVIDIFLRRKGVFLASTYNRIEMDILSRLRARFGDRITVTRDRRWISIKLHNRT